MSFAGRIVELEDVVGEDGAADDERLASLKAIETGKNVDRVSAEYCEEAHVDLVEKTLASAVEGEGRPSSTSLPTKW